MAKKLNGLKENMKSLKKEMIFLENDILNYADTKLGIGIKKNSSIDKLIIELESRKRIEDKEFELRMEDEKSVFKNLNITNEPNQIYQGLFNMIEEWQK